MFEFSTLAEYSRSRVSVGDEIEITYDSKRSPKAGSTTVEGEITEINDNGSDMLLWITPYQRKTTHTVSLFDEDSNLHHINGPGDVQTLNPTDTPVTCRVRPDE